MFSQNPKLIRRLGRPKYMIGHRFQKLTPSVKGGVKMYRCAGAKVGHLAAM